ncbi:NAD(P)H-dependent oxidoreductase [Lysinibacillus pakistanensis]|uniref:NAD(P)H-dependent oxidoreductase n=1 Tax=Lysinibacillus pakistanensis TaxID=759811 RepID=UPI003D2966D9
MVRIYNIDNIVFVFPVWWHSIPAMLKGYIDQVFNYWFAYRSNKLSLIKLGGLA